MPPIDHLKQLIIEQIHAFDDEEFLYFIWDLLVREGSQNHKHAI